ncbi:MAG TPA: NADH-quinone oxidoreductase subunit L [Ilumatobacter sp.]|nr:NADH-quinone oxidoreductase subunit L [Ilumatobacter sp.]
MSVFAAEAVADPGWFLENAWLIPVIPAVAFFGIIFFGKRLPRGGSELGIVSMLASLVIAAGMTLQWISHVDATHGTPVIKQWTWWQSGGLHFQLGQHIDGLAVMALILVAFISTLVQIYSTEYVRGDRRYTHFFAALTLFSAGMLTMVLAPNMVQLILGWEIMGLCSFMLIGHWWEEQANSRAALKAFFTVRVGDMGLLVGTAMLFGIFGTFDIAGINELTAAGDFESKQILMWAAIALFIACIGKSGQFPLHTWLPDAMAGPTPVSSLLHSSTMVVAGVFLVARIYPVFHVGLEINLAGQEFNLIAVIGGITVLVAAALAFVQDDIKKVLAYSTVSQLGYMMMGLGVGAWTAAVFHIFTHAFFKCCLFLCAGSISHTAAHHSFDMKKDMGGIWRKMPVTFATWMISTAALMGIPFFSGFFSKDEIIDSAKHNDYTIFYFVGIIGAFMTAAYMTRATWLTFFGTPRGGAAHFMGVESHDDHGHAAHDAHGDDAHGHDDHGHDDHGDVKHGRPLPFAPSDSPWQLTAPLIILAALAIGSGYLNAPAVGTHWFHHQTESSIGLHEAAGHGEEAAHDEAADHGEETAAHGEEAAHGPEPAEIYTVPPAPEFKWSAAAPGLGLVALGIGLSAFLSKAVFEDRRAPFAGLTRRNKLLGAGHRFLVNKLYLDALYENVIVKAIAHPISKAAYWVNQNIIDGVVNGAGRTGKDVGTWVYRNIDQKLVDGAVNASGTVASETGHALQPVQSGKVNQYGALLFGAAAVGAIVLIITNV